MLFYSFFKVPRSSSILVTRLSRRLTYRKVVSLIRSIEKRDRTEGQGDQPNRPSLCERGMSAARLASTVVMDAASLPHTATATKRDRRMRDVIFERR